MKAAWARPEGPGPCDAGRFSGSLGVLETGDESVKGRLEPIKLLRRGGEHELSGSLGADREDHIAHPRLVALRVVGQETHGRLSGHRDILPAIGAHLQLLELLGVV